MPITHLNVGINDEFEYVLLTCSQQITSHSVPCIHTARCIKQHKISLACVDRPSCFQGHINKNASLQKRADKNGDLVRFETGRSLAGHGEDVQLSSRLFYILQQSFQLFSCKYLTHRVNSHKMTMMSL